jgi:curved DNA-binding protein CbpA
MAAVRTHYEILNVAPGAELVVIDAAYRALMKKYHPDQGGGAADGPSAADINRAYAVLRDAQRRAAYDHEEWIRQSDVRMATYPMPPPAPRRSNFFGWGGWLVAAVLTGMIALMASKQTGTDLGAAEQARAAALAAPDLRTQPLPVDKSLVTPNEAADIRSDAYAPRAAAEAPLKPAPAPAPGPAPVPAPAPAPAATVPAPPPTSISRAPAAVPHVARPTYYARRHGHRHGAAVAARHDKDFLERQGYIY